MEEQLRKQAELAKQAEERKRQTMAQMSTNRGNPIPVENIAEKYGEDTTVEKIQLNKIMVTRSVHNRDGVITFFTRVEHDNGSVYHFKNGEYISAWQYNHETK